LARQQQLSSIGLFDGGVLITNTAVPGIIVFGQSGSRIDLRDDGGCEFLASGSGHSAVLENETEASPQAEVAPENSSGGEAGRSYTLDLFSTRCATVADRVNRNFRTAGHKSVILRRETGSTIRYRVVVPGFESRESARQFVGSIVGKPGISDTWIGEGKSGSL